MREIVFRDDALLIEMLNEWKTDSNLKIEEIKDRYQKKNLEGLFNKIHELKTNFSMIHCAEAIRFSEAILKKIELKTGIEEDEILELETMVASVNKQLDQYL